MTSCRAVIGGRVSPGGLQRPVDEVELGGDEVAVSALPPARHAQPRHSRVLLVPEPGQRQRYGAGGLDHRTDL